MNLLLLETVLLNFFLLATAVKVGSFVEYVQVFRKIYSGQDEMEFRSKIFHDNLELIQEHNSNPNATYRMGVNQFTDRTGDFFAAI